MFPQPPNSQCIADETVWPSGQPPFHWAVFAASDLPEDVIAFYTQALGRAADEAGCKWAEPREQPLDSVTIYPVEQVDTIPPSARGQVPASARTLIFLLEKSEDSSGQQAHHDKQPYQDNVLPKNLSPASLLEATLAGQLIWASSDQGPVLKAGGRAAEGLHAGQEIWITLSRTGHKYLLALTSEMRPYGEPLRQNSGWFSRCELARIWEAAQRSIDR